MFEPGSIPSLLECDGEQAKQGELVRECVQCELYDSLVNDSSLEEGCSANSM
jgi:hypothetical protein